MNSTRYVTKTHLDYCPRSSLPAISDLAYGIDLPANTTALLIARRGWCSEEAANLCGAKLMPVDPQRAGSASARMLALRRHPFSGLQP